MVLGPDPLDDRAEDVIAERAHGALRRIAFEELMTKNTSTGDRQHTADRLDPVRLMVVDEADHHFARRSGSACAKYADAIFRISLARRRKNLDLVPESD